MSLLTSICTGLADRYENPTRNIRQKWPNKTSGFFMFFQPLLYPGFRIHGIIHYQQADFVRNLRLEFHGTTITSDAGLLAHRELDSAWDLTEIAERCLHDVPAANTTKRLEVANASEGTLHGVS